MTILNARGTSGNSHESGYLVKAFARGIDFNYEGLVIRMSFFLANTMGQKLYIYLFIAKKTFICHNLRKGVCTVISTTN